MNCNHERIVCKKCKKIILSCRCMEGGKNIKYIICDNCKKIKE